MKTNSTHQEILLITGTTFSAMQWVEKNEPGTPKNLSEKDRLEDACWNGLLREMLPEIFTEADRSKLFIWHIRKGKSFLELEMGESPVSIDPHFSLDPYTFLEKQSYN